MSLDHPAPHRLQREQHTAVAALREAAGLCRRLQAGIAAKAHATTDDTDAFRKEDLSPVTLADFGSQALVCHSLETWLPDDPVVAEEDAAALQEPGNAALLGSLVAQLRTLHPEADAEEVCRWIDRGRADGHSRRFWTLDPIDGTKGFVRGDQYAISLGLIIEGQVALGALACPNLSAEALAAGRLRRSDPNEAGSLLIAVKDHGVSLLPLDDPSTEGRPVGVSSVEDAAAARLCESVESGHTSHAASAQITARLGSAEPAARIDSQAKYAAVAVGAAEVYLRLPTERRYRERIWDHAGGVRVVLEAGGRVTDIHGHALDFSHGRNLEANRGVVVSNGRFHDQIIRAVAEAGVR